MRQQSKLFKNKTKKQVFLSILGKQKLALKMEAKMRLREWLIAQIDSGKYAGLSWENEDKTIFRIPWKHAAKQDYKLNEDAALFKVRMSMF